MITFDTKPEDVVNKIFNRDKMDYEKKRSAQKMKGDPFLKFQRNDAFWKKIKEDYLRLEIYYRKNPDRIPTWELVGPLHYGMTIHKMRAVVVQKFRDMASKEKIIKESVLFDRKDRSSFYPPEGKGSDNLTRIWGAEFLKSHLTGSSNLDVAEHYLVVEEGATEIEVKIALDDFLVLSTVKNAYILSEEIVGEKKAYYYRNSKLKDLNFRDFSDPGNIICDSKGIGFVVDTELKSFDPPPVNRITHELQVYLKKRFRALNEGVHLPIKFTISLDDL